MDTKPDSRDLESDTILTTDLDTSEGKVILSNNINKEIDKIFGPAIQRNRSGSDIDITGPFRRRHYWSQEHLFADKPLHHNSIGDDSSQGLNSFQIDELKSLDESRSSQIPVLHENQRAEIVASVTERLYSKLKKNEKSIPKIESVLDKKGIQSLSELKICSNARQRLMELSQKALRNKRRIGIPAYTQTKGQVTRVKNQGIDIQADLQSLIDSSQHNAYILRKDACIQTELMTPRLKEKAVGSNYDSVNYSNKDTSTQTNVACYKDNMTMTSVVIKNNNTTQTFISQQIKTKNSALPSYSPNKCASKIDSVQSTYKDNNLSPCINIKISPIYSNGSGHSSDSEDFTEDESEPSEDNVLIFDNNEPKLQNPTEYKESRVYENDTQNEFSDDESSVIPRVGVDRICNINIDNYEELILGRNEDTCPYNIKLSPCKNADENKRAIKFADNDLLTDPSVEDDIIKSSSTESRLKLTAPEYSNEQVSKKVESMQQSTVHNNQSELENDDKESKSDNIEFFKRIKNPSPIRLENEFKADEIESGTSLYYSLNSFFKTRQKKRTPTEYLHYLIQKRREAISMDSNLRVYRRNTSF